MATPATVCAEYPNCESCSAGLANGTRTLVDAHAATQSMPAPSAEAVLRAEVTSLRNQVATLLAQHTRLTGMAAVQAAFAALTELTAEQPLGMRHVEVALRAARRVAQAPSTTAEPSSGA